MTETEKEAIHFETIEWIRNNRPPTEKRIEYLNHIGKCDICSQAFAEISKGKWFFDPWGRKNDRT